MNWLNMMRKKFPLMIWQTVLTALSVFSMTSMAALLQFDVNAVEWEGAAVSPSSCSVGDTITISVSGGAAVNEYRYSYRIAPDENYDYLTDWTSSPTFNYVPTVAGEYYFLVIANDGQSSTNTIAGSVTVTEGSAESSDESSEESSQESSFSPMQWLPGWDGQQYVQPSADSTPTLELSLPSDVQFSVSDGIGGVLSSAFQAFPAPLLGLIIPSVIALFVGWWLHK